MKKYEIRVLFLAVLAASLILIAGCGTQTATVMAPTPSQTVTPFVSTLTPTPSDGSLTDALGLSDLAQLVPTRTPEPTVTPDILAGAVEDIVRGTGLSERTLLGLSVEDWFNLVASLLSILVTYLIGTWVIGSLITRLVRRSKTNLDDRLLKVSGNEVRWLVVVLVLGFATNRLEFVNPAVKTALSDIYFMSALVLTLVIVWRLIGLAAQEAESRAKHSGQQSETESLITLLVWGFRLGAIIFAISLSLTHFGVDITGFALLLGIIGLAISFAGRDVLADIIAGAMILIDRPYRIGDRVEISSLDSWGDVVEIGMRSTKVLAIDNRMLIVPNSVIGKNQIVNYSYPDPSLFDQSLVMVAYNNDVDQVGQLLIDIIKTVEGVDSDREIGAWLLEFTENQVVFTIGWWIPSYVDKYYVRNRVNRAIVRALNEAGVVLPYQKEQVELKSDSDRSENP